MRRQPRRAEDHVGIDSPGAPFPVDERVYGPRTVLRVWRPRDCGVSRCCRRAEIPSTHPCVVWGGVMNLRLARVVLRLPPTHFCVVRSWPRAPSTVTRADCRWSTGCLATGIDRCVLSVFTAHSSLSYVFENLSRGHVDGRHPDSRRPRSLRACSSAESFEALADRRATCLIAKQEAELRASFD